MSHFDVENTQPNEQGDIRWQWRNKNYIGHPLLLREFHDVFVHKMKNCFFIEKYALAKKLVTKHFLVTKSVPYSYNCEFREGGGGRGSCCTSTQRFEPICTIVRYLFLAD